MARFRRDLEALGAARAELEKKREETLTLRGEAERRRRRLDAQRQEKTALLTTIVERKEVHLTYAEELAQAETKLEQLLAGSSAEEVAVPIAVFRGSLPWPAEGRVPEGFASEVVLPLREGARAVVREALASLTAELLLALEGLEAVEVVVDGAVRELRRRGYRDLTLIGHSTGANKVAIYDHYKPRNFVKRYVLLAGGDDTGLLYDHLGPRRFAAALKKAREKIRARHGDELAPPSISQLPMSWRSFSDTANPDGDYNVFPFLEVMRNIRLSRKPRFRHLRTIRKPALILYGDGDQYMYGDVSRCVAILADILGVKPNIELAVIAEADHGFGGRERELGEVIVRWMEARDPR